MAWSRCLTCFFLFLWKTSCAGIVWNFPWIEIPLLFIKWSYMLESVSGHPILFLWASCLFYANVKLYYSGITIYFSVWQGKSFLTILMDPKLIILPLYPDFILQLFQWFHEPSNPFYKTVFAWKLGSGSCIPGWSQWIQ